VTDFLFEPWAALIVASAAGVLLGVVWFLLPLRPELRETVAKG